MSDDRERVVRELHDAGCTCATERVMTGAAETARYYKQCRYRAGIEQGIAAGAASMQRAGMEGGRGPKSGAAVEYGRAMERAAIVEWLRGFNGQPIYPDNAADYIARNAHTPQAKEPSE